MKYEQQEIMKVIEFPGNRQFEDSKRSEKLKVAIAMLEYCYNENTDFSIVVDNKAALGLFEGKDENLIKDYLIITTSRKSKEHFKIDSSNSSMYEITGNEFD